MEKLVLIICPLRTTAPLVMRYFNLGTTREIGQSALSNHRATERSISRFGAIRSSDGQVPSTCQKAELQPISAPKRRYFRSARLSASLDLQQHQGWPSTHVFTTIFDRRDDTASQGKRSIENLNKLFTYLFSHNGAPGSL